MAKKTKVVATSSTNPRNTAVLKMAQEGYNTFIISTVTNGEPADHIFLVGLEKVTGGEMLNIFTSPETKSIFAMSNLKERLLTLALNVVGVDYRDYNHNVNSNFSALDKAFLTATESYTAKYKELGMKPLAYEYIKKILPSEMSLAYEEVIEIISNDLTKFKAIPIDSSVYKSKEDLLNIQINQANVEGTNLPECAASTLKAFELGTHTCALFYGEASTGKSFAGRIIGAKLGIPVYSYNFAAGSDESFVQGKYAPKEDEAGFTFLKNSFIKAFTEGGLFIAEELNYAYSNVTGPLNSALDFLKKITLANEKHCDMHPNFRMITAINPGYEGTQPLNRALLSRQEIVVRFQSLKPSEVADRLLSRYGYANIEFSTKVAEFIEKVNKILFVQSIDGYLSLREVESCLKLALLDGMTLKDAIIDSMLNKVLLNETSETYDAIIDTVSGDIKDLTELYSQVSSTDAEPDELTILNINDSEIEDIFANASTAYASGAATGTATV